MAADHEETAAVRQVCGEDRGTDGVKRWSERLNPCTPYYTTPELSALLRRYLGDEHTYDPPVVGREKARKALEDALERERMSSKWGVITAVGTPGSGKTFFLRAGILRNWYPDNSVMMYYFEDATILDDGKMDVITAFARQLVQSNEGRKDIDFERIDGLDTVVAAFRLNLGLSKSEMLIVCIDGIICLQTHVGKQVGLGEAAGRARCKELRAALMAYQDNCTDRGKPEIRFVWTSPTEHFETSLLEAEGRQRAHHLIPLYGLSEEDSWQLLREDLRELGRHDSLLRWGFHLCAGNPRALAHGLSDYKPPSEDWDPVRSAEQVESAILQTCGLFETDRTCVSQHLCTVLAAPESLAEGVRERLLMSGVLHQGEHGTLRLHPVLVRKWAKERRSALQLLVHEYFDPDRFEEETAFEWQTYLFEQILNCAYAELVQKKKLTQKPTLQEYFAGAAFCGDATSLRRLVVHPRQLPGNAAFKPSLEVKTCLEAGTTVYSQDRIETSGSSSFTRLRVLIPLHLAETETQSPRTHIFCWQGRRGVVGAVGPTDAEVGVSAGINTLDLQDAHELHLTTQNSGSTGGRTGAWFAQTSLEKWLGRMGMLRYPQPHMRSRSRSPC